MGIRCLDKCSSIPSPIFTSKISEYWRWMQMIDSQIFTNKTRKGFYYTFHFSRFIHVFEYSQKEKSYIRNELILSSNTVESNFTIFLFIKYVNPTIRKYGYKICFNSRDRFSVIHKIFNTTE